MNNEGWIDITEYAVKYRVSQSTLRRRIRGNTIAYRMDRGKYLLLDSPEALNKAPLFSRQNMVRQATPSRPSSSPQHQPPIQSWNRTPWNAQGSVDGMETFQSASQSTHMAQASTQTTTNDSVEELRRLQTENKALREQLAEAETLVKVLEAELSSFNA